MELKTKEFKMGDTTYTLQSLPVRQALKLRDRWIVGGEASQEKMYELLLENVVVQPKVKLDDFETVAEVETLGLECLEFLYGEKEKN